MIGIYLLVSIFTQLCPTLQFAGSSLWATPFSLAPASTLQVEVNFGELNGLKIGSPVLVDGRRAGKVASISQENEGEGDYHVSLVISSGATDTIGSQSVALQAAPMSISRTKPETVVELVSLPGSKGDDLKGGEHLSGFSSLEEFWTSGPRHS